MKTAAKKRSTAEKPAKVPPTEAQVRGWAIRDAILSLVEPHLEHQTPARWRTTNGFAALDMAEAGTTVEQAVDAWNAFFARTGNPIIKLATLAERMAVDAARVSATRRDDPAPFWGDDGDAE
ncbi:MAG: hypothetical protein IAI48_00625 [Candidatus Eremiobacteraeota bacterium]|nr:hypothetical protein [Candidatus Eremiobacteraeota bacterium]